RSARPLPAYLRVANRRPFHVSSVARGKGISAARVWRRSRAIVAGGGQFPGGRNGDAEGHRSPGRVEKELGRRRRGRGLDRVEVAAQHPLAQRQESASDGEERKDPDLPCQRQGDLRARVTGQSGARRSLRALPITETDDRLIAAAAM